MAVSVTKPCKLKMVNLPLKSKKEVNEAMQEIIERWQPKIKELPLEALFAERQRQVKNFSDFETVLTELVEEEYGK